ncbi:MAG: large conductance mechanosensitive channel protein MscL [Nitrospirae bacterium]|nr:large conductance mechanosensitive channel protein MscL [Nitrospirota bacterium]
MIKEFKEFAMRGSVIDMAVGIIIGAAYGSIVNSLVSNIIMPPIGLLLGNVDFANLFLVLKHGAKACPYASLADAQSAGAVTINYGLFEPVTQKCPYCLSTITIGATRCPHCTSEIKEA